jgi:hypothetical protein
LKITQMIASEQEHDGDLSEDSDADAPMMKYSILIPETDYIEEEDEGAEFDEISPPTNQGRNPNHYNKHNIIDCPSGEELPLIKDVDRSKFGVIHPGDLLDLEDDNSNNSSS